MYYIIIAALLTGCAFKGEHGKTTTGSNAQAFSKTVTVSWEGESGSASVKRGVLGSVNFSLNEPITIPAVAPDKIRVTFDTPIVTGGKILQEPRVFISEVTDEKTVAKPIRLGGAIDGATLEVSGLRTFFAVDKQQRGIIKIGFQNAITGEQEATLNFVLISPPITSEIRFDGKNTVEDLRLRKLASNQIRLDLITVLRIKNTSQQRQEYILPNELKGHLKKDFIFYHYSEKQCHTDTWTHGYVENYPARFFILPLDESLEEDWVVRLTEEERSFYLEPGQEQFLGIYGSGAHMNAFTDGGAPSSRPQTIQVVDRCEWSTNQVENLISARDPREPRDPPPRKERIYRNIAYGLQTEGAQWVLEPPSRTMQVRNGFLPRQDDPVSRVFDYLMGELRIF